jgi:hypothetical protein
VWGFYVSLCGADGAALFFRRYLLTENLYVVASWNVCPGFSTTDGKLG